MSDLTGDIIAREGGYVDNADDHGGPTNMGITMTTLEHWRGHPVTVYDVRDLTVGEARLIYERLYIKDPGFDRIEDERLRDAVVDMGVNMGVSAATKALQHGLWVPEDGVMGPLTLDALKASDPGTTRLRVLAVQVRRYGAIISKDPSQAKFAAGWLNRLADKLES